MPEEIALWVNGVHHQAFVDPEMTLLAFLRERLGLTGAKNGCGQGHCGACTVIVEGKPARSCVTLMRRAAGKHVETIEGLARDGKLDALQRAFIDEGAVQCGFCTPGMIMAAKSLLDRNPSPSETEIRGALRHNLCRCTGYAAILRAIRAASQGMPASAAGAASPLTAVGQSLSRPDAIAKVTGKAMYAADFVFPGMLHAKVLRSRLPHARLAAVRTARARMMPGVVAILTARDVPGTNLHGLERPDWPVLCDDKVRYVGDAIAVVVAESENEAERALAQIDVTYEPLEVIDTPKRALMKDAPKIHASGNLAKHIEFARGDVQQGFAQADLVVERTYRTARAEHAFLEPEASVATVDEQGRVTVYVGSQIPFEDRRQVAEALGLPESRVRVIHTETGGAFGGKEDIAGQIHAALASWVTKRPVKLVYTRSESIISHPKRHATTIRLKTGVMRNGKLVALEAEIVGDTGAYASLGPHVMTRTATHATGPYEIPNVSVRCDAVYTNNIPAGAFRGFGVSQATFASETQMDVLAQELGLSPWEIRRRNAFRPGSTTATGQVLGEDVGLLETLAQTKAAWSEASHGRWINQGSEGRKRGWGIACAYKNVGLGGGAPDSAGASVEVLGDDSVLVKAGAADVGQGLATVLTQIAVEELGVPYGLVKVIVGDTDLTLDDGPTTASRQTFVTGNAVRLACVDLRERLDNVLADAATLQGASVSSLSGRTGEIRPARGGPWSEAVARAREKGASLRAEHIYIPPSTMPLGQEGDMHFAFGYTTQAVEVEVDTASGVVKVLRVFAAHDVGRAVNPQGVVGQIEGGVVMGVGLSIREELPMEGGIPLATSLAAYRIPTAEETPDIVPIIVQVPSQEGPYGAKGIGEIPSIPTPPAVTNAIYNACGARLLEIPATPERVLAALQH